MSTLDKIKALNYSVAPLEYFSPMSSDDIKDIIRENGEDRALVIVRLFQENCFRMNKSYTLRAS